MYKRQVKDNATIYLEPVPSQATLKDVPGAGMVKPVPFVQRPLTGVCLDVRGKRLLNGISLLYYVVMRVFAGDSVGVRLLVACFLYKTKIPTHEKLFFLYGKKNNGPNATVTL